MGRLTGLFAAFMKAYMEGCKNTGKELMNIPPQWQEYVENANPAVAPTVTTPAATMCSVSIVQCA